MSETKQVIVMRKDLGMRKGKMISQGAHASTGCILNMMETDYVELQGVPHLKKTFFIEIGSALDNWLIESFTKITVSVDSEEELLELYEQAQKAELPCILITDSGKTEFKKPTITCIVIGPGYVEDIDKITKHLKLL